MDAQAASLLSTLKRPAAPSDAKLHALNQLKSDIKHHRVPETAQATIFECLRLAIAQQVSSTLALSAYSTLGHLIKRLKIQDQTGTGHAIQQLAPRLFPALQDRLGDLKEPIRNATSQALSELYHFLSQDVEHIIREEALPTGNSRAKEAAVQWVVRMHRDENMPFKTYTSNIVARLEDADGNVRECAKTSLVQLFSHAPEGAKTDLKRRLKAHGVRHSIATHILAQIGSEMNESTGSKSRPQTREAPVSRTQTPDLGASTRSLPAVDHIAQHADTINSEAAKPPPAEEVPMDPIYVHSQRELEDTFRDMLPCFEGRETEENWMLRDRSTLKLRRLLKGNAPSDYHREFMFGIKSLMDGILKVANSLRTTMSTNGSQLVQELARTLGPAFDSHGEIVLQNFIKMSAATKPISAQNGRATAEAVFQNCSYTARMMQHLWSAAQDKNAQTRQNVPEWLKVILRRQSAYKAGFDSSGGLELAEKCIKKGLDDPKPAVKEGTRSTFWTFHRSWPERAERIMKDLSAQAQSALQKDPANPNAGLHASTATAAPAAAARPAGSRMAMREMIAEQRKAKAAGRLPDRPNSAMANLSPSKPRAGASEGGAKRDASRAPPSHHFRDSKNITNNSSRVPSAASTAASETPGEASKAPTAAAKKSALMSGPVRRPRRPEIPRPQTADPYASRRLLRPETPARELSPGNSPPKGAAPANLKSGIPGSGRDSAVRNRAKTAAEGKSPRGGSPRVMGRGGSPGMGLSHAHPAAGAAAVGGGVGGMGSRPGSKGSGVASGAAGDVDLTVGAGEDFTMVMPGGRTAAAAGGQNRRPGLGQTTSVDSGITGMEDNDEEEEEEGDGFTMVLPGQQQTRPGYASSEDATAAAHGAEPRARSPLAYRSPLKALFEEARDKLSRSASPPASRDGGGGGSQLNGLDAAIEAAAGANGRAGSPLVSRRSSPVKGMPGTPQAGGGAGVLEQEIRIYEDAAAAEADGEAHGAAAAEEAGRKVLGELQVNENVPLHQHHPQRHARGEEGDGEGEGDVSPAHSAASSPAGSPRRSDERASAAAPAAAASVSAQEKTEVLRNRKLLASGRERIRTRTLDAHGFRRVAEIVRASGGGGSGEIWEGGGERWEDLTAVVLEYLRGFEPEAEAGMGVKAAGLKAQALGLLRALVGVASGSGSAGALHNKKTKGSLDERVGAWLPRALVTVYVCRSPRSSSSSSSSSPAAGTAPSAGASAAASDVEKTAAAVVAAAQALSVLLPCLAATVQYLLPSSTTNAATPPDLPAPATTAFALRTLRVLLAARLAASRAAPAPLDPALRTALARTAAAFLGSPDAGVRKNGVELGSEVFGLFVAAVGEDEGQGREQGAEEKEEVVVGGGREGGEGGGGGGVGAEGFWREFRGVEEGRLGLLTYYIARRGVVGGRGLA